MNSKSRQAQPHMSLAGDTSRRIDDLDVALSELGLSNGPRSSERLDQPVEVEPLPISMPELWSP